VKGRAERRCGKKTRKGGQCGKPAGWGTSHHGEGPCKLHGGRTAQAEVAGLVELARRERQVMGQPLSIEPQDAILECIRISAGEVAYASERIGELEVADAVAPARTSMVRKSDDGTVQEVRQGEPRLHAWIRARREAMDRLVSYSFAALKAGIEERRIKIAEQQGTLLAQAVQGILRDLGVDVAPQTEVAGIVRKHLTLLSGAGGA
jgi:hypothetical protein